MKFVFKVQEPATFFHFLDSISQWNIHTRKNIEEYYKNRFGITNQDRKVIRKYKKIRKKYGWGKLDSDFVIAKNFKEVEKNLEKRLSRIEFLELKEIIDYFYPNIHAIYMEWVEKLKERRRRLENLFTKHKIEKIFFEIAEFYESKKYPNMIYVHLLVNTLDNFAGGGANIIPKKHITLEPPNLNKNDRKEIKHSISIIVHETLHIIERHSPKKKLELFIKEVEKQKLDFNILREAIADTLAPAGYLTRKYKINERSVLIYKDIEIPNKKEKGKYYLNMRRKLSAFIYPLTEKQIKNRLSLFEGDYIENCINEYKKIT